MLMGVKIGTAAVEKRTVVPQKIKHSIAMRSSRSLSGWVFKSIERRNSGICTYKFITALFTIAKGESNASVHRHTNGLKIVVHTYRRISFSLKKEWNSEIG